MSTHGQPAAIPFQPQDMDSRRSSVPQNDSAVKDPYSSSSSLPPSAQTAQPPTIPPVEIKVTYCRSDWARFAVAELAQHFPPGFHVQEQPEWDDATILVKSPWGRCSPTAKNVIPIDMENRVHHPRANTVRRNHCPFSRPKTLQQPANFEPLGILCLGLPLTIHPSVRLSRRRSSSAL